MAKREPVVERGTEMEFVMPVAHWSDAVSVFERLAKDPAVDVAKLEHLMQLHSRVLDQQAETAWNAAMSDAQAAMRPVSTDASNPSTRSRYASYAAIDGALRPIYARHGFALSFDTDTAGTSDAVRVLCRVSHRGGAFAHVPRRYAGGRHGREGRRRDDEDPRRGLGHVLRDALPRQNDLQRVNWRR